MRTYPEAKKSPASAIEPTAIAVSANKGLFCGDSEAIGAPCKSDSAREGRPRKSAGFVGTNSVSSAFSAISLPLGLPPTVQKNVSF